MQLKKSLVLSVTSLSVLSAPTIVAQADDWAAADKSSTVEIDGGEGVLSGFLDGMKKNITYKDTVKNRIVKQYFPDSPFPGSTSRLSIQINGTTHDIRDSTASKYYTKTDGTKAEFTKGDAVISQDLTPGPHGGILVTYSVKNAGTTPMNVMMRENIDTQLDKDDNVPVKSLGDDKGVYILKAPYRLEYRMDVPQGPDQFAGRKYTERDFPAGGHVRVTEPADTSLYTGDTGIHMQWNEVTIAPGETKSFSYEVKLAGTSTIAGTLTRDQSSDDTPETNGKLYPQMPLKLSIKSDLEGVNYKAPSKKITFKLPQGMTYQGDKITVTWSDGSNSELPVTKDGDSMSVDVSQTDKWSGSHGTLTLTGNVIADQSLENQDVKIDAALTTQGTTRGVIKGHIDEIPARKVIVKYVDEYGNEIDKSVSEEIRKRKPYDMNPKKKAEIIHDDIEYEYYDTDGPATGTVGNNHITVQFKYRPKPAKNVVVTFKTKTGRTLQDDQSLAGKQKDPVFPQGKDGYLALVKKIEEPNGDLWELIPPTSVPEKFTTKDQRLDLTYYLARTSRTEPIPFATEIIEDETMQEGEEKVTVDGWTGERQIITYFDQSGKQTNEEERVIKHMRTKIIHRGVKNATTAVEKQPVKYTTRTVEDPTMMLGERKVVQQGQFGERTITRTWETWRKYKIGKPIKVDDKVTKEPIEEIIHVGTRENIMEVDYDILRHKRINSYKDVNGTDGGRANHKTYAIAKGKIITEVDTTPHLLRMPVDDIAGKEPEKPKVIDTTGAINVPEPTIARPSENVKPTRDSIRPAALSVLRRATQQSNTPTDVNEPKQIEPIATDNTISAIRKLYNSLKNLSVRRWK